MKTDKSGQNNKKRIRKSCKKSWITTDSIHYYKIKNTDCICKYTQCKETYEL